MKIARFKLGELSSLESTILGCLSNEATLKSLIDELLFAPTLERARAAISKAAHKIPLTQLGD